MLKIAAYNFKAIAEGCLSLIPGGNRLFKKGTQGSDSARYCYSVWMRHMVNTHCHRKFPMGGIVVELGPGDSLGTGLAALLSGACRYIAIDAVRHANHKQNQEIFSELVQLFKNRAPIPDDDEFPEIKPKLDNYSFPIDILDPVSLADNLSPTRISAIASALNAEKEEDSPIAYVAPSKANTVISASSIDMIFSQAVLEHVDGVRAVYSACNLWLKPGSLMSHQIDFKSHGTSTEWNGHWVYPEWIWKLIRGHRSYLLNREPCGTHIRLLNETKFELIGIDRARMPSRLRQHQLAKRFRDVVEDDLNTAGVYIIARKSDGLTMTNGQSGN